MNFSENELHRKDPLLSFMVYGDVGKRVLKFETNFSVVFEVLSSNDRSNYIIQNGFRKLGGQGNANLSKSSKHWATTMDATT